ncbi:hypothetical protein NW768_008659 [Fusarium equiseti]|uniref:Transcription factor domain-containing protein n=1 Tax=Fusarium equiseti TaxID=61235 RepID=A0ABQ8R4X8_FUSEQ|nr:hypothetical protein NW768_008659 [Fusarium equiseti]
MASRMLSDVRTNKLEEENARLREQTSQLNTESQQDPEPSERGRNDSLTMSASSATVGQPEDTAFHSSITGIPNFQGVDPDFCNHLLSNFWDRQIYSSLVYRAAFIRDMENDGPYFSGLLLYAILFAGSHFTVEEASTDTIAEMNAAGRRYRAEFEQTLFSSGSESLFKSEVTKIQALLVVSETLFSWCNERNLS